MKNPLRYQLSEYDCGPTSMLNALAFLFEREDIPPEAVRNIMLYCLDCYGSDGVSGKSGTSCAAMMFLSNWLNGFGKIGRLHISTQYLSGPAVNFGQNSRLRDALRCGGAAVVRLHFDGEHYVTLTGIDENDMVRVFDPYYINLIPGYNFMQEALTQKSDSIVSKLDSYRSSAEKALSDIADTYAENVG